MNKNFILVFTAFLTLWSFSGKAQNSNPSNVHRFTFWSNNGGGYGEFMQNTNYH